LELGMGRRRGLLEAREDLADPRPLGRRETTAWLGAGPLTCGDGLLGDHHGHHGQDDARINLLPLREKVARDSGSDEGGSTPLKGLKAISRPRRPFIRRAPPATFSRKGEKGLRGYTATGRRSWRVRRRALSRRRRRW